MSTLPQMPTGFAMGGSPYPPHPGTSRATTPKPARRSPPPQTPPKLPPDARQAELNWRQQNGYGFASTSAGASSNPTPRSFSQQHNGDSHRHHQHSSFSPGQLVNPGATQQPRAASYNFTSSGRALSPAPPGAGFRAPSPTSRALSPAPPGPGFRAPSPGFPAHYGPSITRATSAAPTDHRTHAPPQHRHSEIGPYYSANATLYPHHPQQPRRASAAPIMPTATPAPAPTPNQPPPLAKPIPDMAMLADKRERALASGEERAKLNWAKLVIKYVEREHTDAMALKDPTLLRYIDEAMAVVNRRAAATPPDVDALFTRGELRASGNFPSYHRKDPKNAFNDFEYSGRMGYPPAWFRIGRDYETLNDIARGKDAYERGRGFQDVGCIYRLGMAHLLGQLNIKQDYAIAMTLLREAADLANDDTPQPAYIYGMLFAGEFAHLNIPPSLLAPPPDPANPHLPPTSERAALRYIERAAYLNFAPAQYKLGWAYEYAQLDAAFDPLLSVQYYSLASKGGEVEADMAVSKWFLCGAEGCFDKNEDLAYTFAEKAARKGLPTAEFALAYYNEVGVGCAKNLAVAKKWYKKASAHGNDDAKERLEALQGAGDDGAAAFTRTEYEAQLESRLTRKHTAAKQRSLKEGRNNAAVNKQRRDSERPPIDGTPANVDGVQSTFAQMSMSGAASQPSHQQQQQQQVSRQKTLKMVDDAAQWQQQPATHTPMPMPMPMPAPAPASAPVPMPAPSTPRPQRVVSPSPAQYGLNGAANIVGSPPSTLYQSVPSTPQGSAYRSRMPSSSGPPPVPPPTTGPRLSAGGPMHPGLSNGHSQAPSNGHGPGHSQAPSNSASDVSSSAATGSSTSTSTAKKYNTFAEMGFESKAGKDDKDCVVM